MTIWDDCNPSFEEHRTVEDLPVIIFFLKQVSGTLGPARGKDRSTLALEYFIYDILVMPTGIVKEMSGVASSLQPRTASTFNMPTSYQ